MLPLWCQLSYRDERYMHLTTCEWNERNIGPQYKYLFILYKSWVIKYYVPILGLVLSLVYHAVLWVRSHNNNIAAWNAHTRPKALLQVFSFTLFRYFAIYSAQIIYTQSRLCFRAITNILFARILDSPCTYKPNRFFNPHIYSSQQTVVQRVYATSCAFLR